MKTVSYEFNCGAIIDFEVLDPFGSTLLGGDTLFWDELVLGENKAGEFHWYDALSVNFERNGKKVTSTNKEPVYNWYVCRFPNNIGYYEAKEIYYNALNVSQDVHSKEFHAWLNETARWYNEGFAEAYEKIDKTGYCEKTIEGVSDSLNTIGRFYAYSSNGNGWYSQIEGCIIKKNNVYYLKGNGFHDGPGSDSCVNSRIDWKFSSIAEVEDCLRRHGNRKYELKLYK